MRWWLNRTTGLFARFKIPISRLSIKMSLQQIKSWYKILILDFSKMKTMHFIFLFKKGAKKCNQTFFFIVFPIVFSLDIRENCLSAFWKKGICIDALSVFDISISQQRWFSLHYMLRNNFLYSTILWYSSIRHIGK